MKNVRELLQVNEEPLPRLYCDMDQVLCCIFKQLVKQILVQDFQKSIEILVGKRYLMYQRILGKSTVYAWIQEDYFKEFRNMTHTYCRHIQKEIVVLDLVKLSGFRRILKFLSHE